MRDCSRQAVGNEVGIVGNMIACDHCGELAPDASRFCPACGNAFDSQAQRAGAGNSDVASMSVVEQPDDMHIQAAAPVDADEILLPAYEAMPIGRIVMLCVNVALLCVFLGLVISIILIRSAGAENVPATPTITISVTATDTLAIDTPTRTVSQTPTTAAVRVFPTATNPAPKPSPHATATPVPTSTPDVPPTPIRPTPVPTATPMPK